MGVVSNNMRDNPKPGQDKDIKFGMAKEPEQVLIEYEISPSPWLEKPGIKVSVG